MEKGSETESTRAAIITDKFARPLKRKLRRRVY